MSGFTYDPVGGTRGDVLPPGYAHLHARRDVGDASVLDAAGDFVLGFGMQRGAGLRVTTSLPRAVVGGDLTLHIGPGRLAITAPTRVVHVVEEPDRRGFAYGTLPGHPERGEELFLVVREGGRTYAEVRAYSRPASWYARLGGPATVAVQHLMARRYLRAVQRAVGA